MALSMWLRFVVFWARRSEISGWFSTFCSLGSGSHASRSLGGAVELHAKLLELRKGEPLYTVIDNAGGKVGGVTKTYKVAEGTIDTAGLKNTGEVVD